MLVGVSAGVKDAVRGIVPVILVLAQVLQLPGDVLRVGVFQVKGLHNLVLRVGGVQRGREFLDLLEVGRAGKDHQRVGGVAGGNFDQLLGLLAGELLVEGLDLLGKVQGAEVFQGDYPHDDVVVLVHVQGVDQPGGGGHVYCSCLSVSVAYC